MKHTWTITAALTAIFVVTQIVGLMLISHDIADVVCDQSGCQIAHQAQTDALRPQTEGAGSFLYILFGVLLGTGLVLVLMKFRKVQLWRAWFIAAVWISIGLALAVVIDTTSAFVIALILAIAKVAWRHYVIHNLTEVLMYSGIGVLLVPIFSLWWALALLLAISLYDMFAVWQSKHMIKMAQFQTDSKLFAGLLIPYKTAKTPTLTAKKSATIDAPPVPRAAPKTAILGGGDVAFPLIFAGVVMEFLIMQEVSKPTALLQTLSVVAGATLALLFLFIHAKKDRFYPAMPFLTAGCILGAIPILISHL